MNDAPLVPILTKRIIILAAFLCVSISAGAAFAVFHFFHHLLCR